MTHKKKPIRNLALVVAFVISTSLGFAGKTFAGEMLYLGTLSQNGHQYDVHHNHRSSGSGGTSPDLIIFSEGLQLISVVIVHAPEPNFEIVQDVGVYFTNASNHRMIVTPDNGVISAK